MKTKASARGIAILILMALSFGSGCIAGAAVWAAKGSVAGGLIVFVLGLVGLGIVATAFGLGRATAKAVKTGKAVKKWAEILAEREAKKRGRPGPRPVA